MQKSDRTLGQKFQKSTANCLTFFPAEKRGWRGFKNWKECLFKSQRKSFISHSALAFLHSLHGPKTRIREWIKPIKYFFSHFLHDHLISYLYIQSSFFTTCLKKDQSSAARAWPHLTSLNTYYRVNVPYHAISALLNKSDKPAAGNHFKEAGTSH